MKYWEKSIIEIIIYDYQISEEEAHNNEAEELVEAIEAKIHWLASQKLYKGNLEEASPKKASNSTAYFS